MREYYSAWPFILSFQDQELEEVPNREEIPIGIMEVALVEVPNLEEIIKEIQTGRMIGCMVITMVIQTGMVTIKEIQIGRMIQTGMVFMEFSFF